jgi:hypothetical protein
MTKKINTSVSLIGEAGCLIALNFVIIGEGMDGPSAVA